MTTFSKITDLNDGRVNKLGGWETNAANAFNVVVYTCNLFAAFSTDAGNTFSQIDLAGLYAEWGEIPLGDQVVIFIPGSNQFALIGLTQTQNIFLALASPPDIISSKGKNWTSYLIPRRNFSETDVFDQPQVSVGDRFIYITCNLVYTGIAIAIRLSIYELKELGIINLPYFIAPGVFFMKPAQNTGGIAYFSQLFNYSTIRFFSWPEWSDIINYYDIPIQNIPTEDGDVSMPDGSLWGGLSRGQLTVLGLTLSGTNLWAAWFGNRKIKGQDKNTFNFPHIGIAIINVQSQTLVMERYIWNPDFAFVWPSLATNVYGDVALAFCWGGGENWNPQFGVGMLTGPDQTLYSVTPQISNQAGGDYISVRQSFPDMTSFCASCYIGIIGPVYHPYFVKFTP
jgi:hypothetical protein